MVEISNLIKGNTTFSYIAVFKNGERKYRATSYVGYGSQIVSGNIRMIFPRWQNSSLQSKHCGKIYEAKKGILSRMAMVPLWEWGD